MEQLKTIKEQITSQVMAQMNNLQDVHTKELGEAIDMIKDLAEAEYYCTVVKAMEEASENKSTNNYYYTDHYYPTSYYRDVDRDLGRMYYSGGGGQNSNSSSPNNANANYYTENSMYMGGNDKRGYYTEQSYPMTLHDSREGRSPKMRKMYMESKDMHHDNSKTMQELESYMQELTQDMMEMIGKASPEEKSLLQKKINMLANKIQNV